MSKIPGQDDTEKREPVPVQPIAAEPIPVSPIATEPNATAAPPVLQYSVSTTSDPVIVARCRTSMEATMLAELLHEAGIEAHITDQNTEVLGPYAAGGAVKVIVPSQDAFAARTVIEAGRSNDVEPIDIYADSDLATVAAFEEVWQLKEAAVTLGAARIESFVPRLVPRGENPRGTGRRFILRAKEAEADEARSVLREFADEPADPRCPVCGSDQARPEATFWDHVRDVFWASGNPRGYTCLGCRHRGTSDSFCDKRWLRDGVIE